MTIKFSNEKELIDFIRSRARVIIREERKKMAAPKAKPVAKAKEAGKKEGYAVKANDAEDFGSSSKTGNSEKNAKFYMVPTKGKEVKLNSKKNVTGYDVDRKGSKPDKKLGYKVTK